MCPLHLAHGVGAVEVEVDGREKSVQVEKIDQERARHRRSRAEAKDETTQ